MSSRERIFVSFSSRNHYVADIARHLMIDLTQQSFDVYTYESPDIELQAGDNIWHECEKEIDKSNYIIALICDEALQSTWVSKEIRHALNTKIPKEIFYVNLSRASSWHRPFDELKTYLSLVEIAPLQDFQTKSDLSLSSEISRKFCESLNRDYTFQAEDPRLPLRTKIKEETYGSSDNLANSRLGVLQKLYKFCDDYEKSVCEGNHKKAQKDLKKIIVEMEETLQVPVAYYPRVLRFGHKLQLIETEKRQSKPVKRIIKQCKKLERNAAGKLDANLYGILGNAFMLARKFDRAFDAFSKTEQRLEATDPAVIHNKIIASISLDNTKLLDDTKLQLNELGRKGFVSKAPGEYSRIISLNCLIDCFEGNIDRLIDQDYKIKNISQNPDLGLQMLDIAYEKAVSQNDHLRANTAYQFLLRLASITQINGNGLELAKLYQRASLMAIDFGDNKGSTSLIENALECEGCRYSVQLLATAALAYHAANKNQKAYDHARRAIDENKPEKQPLGTQKIEYYIHRGIAAWLLRKDDISEFCFYEAGDPNYHVRQLESWVKREKIVKTCTFLDRVQSATFKLRGKAE